MHATLIVYSATLPIRYLLTISVVPFFFFLFFFFVVSLVFFPSISRPHPIPSSFSKVQKGRVKECEERASFVCVLVCPAQSKVRLSLLVGSLPFFYFFNANCMRILFLLSCSCSCLCYETFVCLFVLRLPFVHG